MMKPTSKNPFPPEIIKDDKGNDIGLLCCGIKLMTEEECINHAWYWHNPNNEKREYFENL